MHTHPMHGLLIVVHSYCLAEHLHTFRNSVVEVDPDGAASCGRFRLISCGTCVNIIMISVRHIDFSLHCAAFLCFGLC